LEKTGISTILGSIIFLSVITWGWAFFQVLRKKTEKAKLPPREDIYWKSIRWHFLITSTAIFFSYINRISIFGEINLNLEICALAFAFLVLNHLCIEPLEWKYASPEHKRKIGHYCPHTAKELFLFFHVTLVTALSEEIIYRAVLWGLFYQLTGSYWIAGIISAVLFSISHIGWGLTAVGSTFWVGIGLQFLVFISGGLYVSIAVHFIHNLINGIIYGRLTKETPEEHALSVSEELIKFSCQE
jgi:membrane protease YdiL (CAAX protease family)